MMDFLQTETPIVVQTGTHILTLQEPETPVGGTIDGLEIGMIETLKIEPNLQKTTKLLTRTRMTTIQGEREYSPGAIHILATKLGFMSPFHFYRKIGELAEGKNLFYLIVLK